MQRRFIYALLITIIILCIFNAVRGGPNSATINIIAAASFAAVLLYKYLKFREHDARIHAVPERDRASVEMVTADDDDLLTPPQW
jgi:ABC-type molybdate transport system substrate-binding protein